MSKYALSNPSQYLQCSVFSLVSFLEFNHERASKLDFNFFVVRDNPLHFVTFQWQMADWSAVGGNPLCFIWLRVRCQQNICSGLGEHFSTSTTLLSWATGGHRMNPIIVKVE